MTARSTFFQQLLHTRWRIFEVFLMLLTCFCVSNQQTVGQSIHSNPCSAGGHTWRIICFLRGHAPSDKVSISLTLLICIHLPNVVHFIWPHIYVLLLLLLPCCTTDFRQFMRYIKYLAHLAHSNFAASLLIAAASDPCAVATPTQGAAARTEPTATPFEATPFNKVQIM